MRSIFISLIFTLVLGNYYQSYAQFQSNPNTTVNPHRPAVVPCNSNTFWGIHTYPQSSIYTKISEFTLVNSTITFNGAILSNNPGMNFAFANTNLITGNAGTFYSVDYFTYDTIHMYNGSNWIQLNPVSSGVHFDIAGKGNLLILDGFPSKFYSGGIKYLFKYSGNTIDSIYFINNNYSLACRSLTIDDDYNIWFFIGPDPFASPATYLCKIDTSGTIINQYPLSQNSKFNSAQTGGLFILNNTLYAFANFGNPDHPNTLMPFKIIGDSLVMETPIPFNFPEGADLKSCNQGTLTSISEVPSSLKELSVFPNPAQDQFMLHLPYRTTSNATIQIYNIQGELVKSIKATDTSPINCNSWPRGIYFVSLVDEGKARMTKKVVVM
jgi:hypothetical protein